MGPVLEELAPVPLQFLEGGTRVIAEPAPNHQPVTGGDHADRVELQAAELPDQCKDAVGIRLRSLAGEALGRYGKAPRDRR